MERVKFLWDASTVSFSAPHINNVLKSNLRNICRKLAGTNLTVPLEKFSENQMCSRCFLHWQDNKFKINYKSQKMPITALKVKRLTKMLNNEPNRESNAKFTRKQRIRAKWLLKRAKNKLVIDCEFCRNKTTFALKKCQKATTEVLIPKAHTSQEKLKKNKRKDKNAGLKILSNIEQESSKHRNLPTKKSSPAKPRSKETKNNKEKKNLLQLAVLLKSQSNSTTNKNRLESLFK